MRFIPIVLAIVLTGAAQAGAVISVTGSTPDSRLGTMPHKTTVDLGPLDLAKSEDAPAILERLKQAAERVCTPHETITSELAARVARCKKRALSDTLYLLDNPALSKLMRED